MFDIYVQFTLGDCYAKTESGLKFKNPGIYFRNSQLSQINEKVVSAVVCIRKLRSTPSVIDELFVTFWFPTLLSITDLSVKCRPQNVGTSHITRETAFSFKRIFGDNLIAISKSENYL